MLEGTESTRPCPTCWPGEFETEHAALTFRGPWLKHREVLCDRRKMYGCITVDGVGHCACDGFPKLADVSGDTYTTTYDGVHHAIGEVAIMNALPEDWDRHVVAALKKHGTLGPEMELLWSAILYSSLLPAQHFGVALNPINRMTSLTAKMELAATRAQWEEVRDELLDNWSSIEATVEAPLAAVARRQLCEYICGRSQARVAQGHASDIGPIQICDVADPLLRQMLGGSWCGMTYLCFAGFHTKLPLRLSHAGYVDACGATLNSWASIHRDLRTATANNAIHYYGGRGMSQDLRLVMDTCLRLDGAGVRSSLSLLDLNDQNSRYKFTENYWHCRAISHCPLDRSDATLSERLSALYGPRSEESISDVEVFNYIFARESTGVAPRFATQWEALKYAMAKNLSADHDIESEFSALRSAVETMVQMQCRLKQASESHDHPQITSISREYRAMKMLLWSRELRGELPFGSALVAAYIVACWFVKEMDNVDAGYLRLLETNFNI